MTFFFITATLLTVLGSFSLSKILLKFILETVKCDCFIEKNCMSFLLKGVKRKCVSTYLYLYFALKLKRQSYKTIKIM